MHFGGLAQACTDSFCNCHSLKRRRSGLLSALPGRPGLTLCEPPRTGHAPAETADCPGNRRARLARNVTKASCAGRRVTSEDFLTTEVWTWRGWMSDDRLFVIDRVTSRANHRIPRIPTTCSCDRSDPTFTTADEDCYASIASECGPQPKWSGDVQRLVGDAGVRSCSPRGRLGMPCRTVRAVAQGKRVSIG